MQLDDVLVAGILDQGCHSRIGADERVIVNLEDAAAVEVLAAEVVAGLQLHVALRTPRLGNRRIVKAAHADPGNAAQ